MLCRRSALSFAFVIFIVCFSIFLIYSKILIECCPDKCIILGADMFTQFLSYVKLKIPDLWIIGANYGYNSLHLFPGVILFSLLMRAIYTATGRSMVLTLCIIESLLLAIGSSGIYVFLSNLSNNKNICRGGNSRPTVCKRDIPLLNLLLVILPISVYVLNPGLWQNLYHGMVDYLVSYAVLPWIIYLTRRIISIIFEFNEVNPIIFIKRIAKYAVLIIILLLISFTHIISFSLLMLTTIGYAVVLFTFLFLRNHYRKFSILNKAIIHVAITLVIIVVLLTPFMILMNHYAGITAPTSNYLKTTAYTHRDVSKIISWHALSIVDALNSYDNTVLPLRIPLHVLIFMVSLALLWFKKIKVYKEEFIAWILLYVMFTTLSMGSKAPYPLNTLNYILYAYVPVIRVIGGPFRFAMASGFCISVILGIITASLGNQMILAKNNNFRKLTIKISITVSIALLIVVLLALKISSLIFVIHHVQPYTHTVSYFRNESTNEGYIYVVPSSEWVVPYKLVNTSLIMEEFRGATVLPWPHNILGYVLALNGIPETTGSSLKPYFEHVVRCNLTDLLSILMHYMGVEYIAVDNYVKPITPWLKGEADILTKQVNVVPLTSFGDIKVYKLNFNASTNNISKEFVRVYKYYGIVATNILKLLPLALINKRILDAYPIIVDETTLPFISSLLNKAYFVLMDRAGFYDLVVSNLIHERNTILLNPLQLVGKGQCNGKCSIVAIRCGWGYEGKPYYSLHDGNLLLKKGTTYSLTLDLARDDEYVVLVRVLARGYSGFIEVNGYRKNITVNVRGVELYEPTWLIFKVNASKINIVIKADGDVYLDCIVVSPSKDYHRALNTTTLQLKHTRIYFILLPYELEADVIKRVKLRGLGVVAQGHVTLQDIWRILGINASNLYIVTPLNSTLWVENLSSLNTHVAFKRYSIMEYGLQNPARTLKIYVPFATPNINYRLFSNGNMELRGFGSYLWIIPLQQFNEYSFAKLSFSINTKKYAPGDAFGVALFHNYTFGYKVKFTLKSRVGDVEVYDVSLIKRMRGGPIIVMTHTIALSQTNNHSIDVYIDLKNSNVILIIDDVPCIHFKPDEIYGYGFGLIQWGKDAIMVVKKASIKFSNSISISFSSRNIVRKGYGSKFIPFIPFNNGKLSMNLRLMISSLGKDSAFGVGLLHDGRNGLEIKVPMDENRVIYRVELRKRINGKPYLIGSIALREPIRISLLREINMNITLIKNYSNIDLAISINNQTLHRTLDLKELGVVGSNILLISWGQHMEVLINEVDIHSMILRVHSQENPEVKQINLFTIRPDNGILTIILEGGEHKYLRNDAFAIVYLQSYRPAWKVILPKNAMLFYHIRGLYGISNVYMVNSSSYSATKLVDNIKFHLATKKHVLASLALLTAYILLYFVLSFYQSVLRKFKD